MAATAREKNARDAKPPGKTVPDSFFGGTECPVYSCCTTERELPHCGHCPDLMCEGFTRFRDPDMSEEETQKVLAAMVQNLKTRASEEKKEK